jgi:pimeloyl-ACP methyl ester carboxylesterase
MSFKQKFIKSFDGTKIGYQVAGSGKTPFILCNGLGGSMIAWSPLYKHFGKSFKFITWDYRGLFTSEIPKNKATLGIPYHVLDLEEILKKEGVAKAVYGGWSMGVQVALEAYRRHPKRFKGLFLINGTYGYPLNTAFNSPLTRYIVPALNRVIKQVLPRLQPTIAPVAKQVISTDEFMRLISRIGLIHRNFDSKILRQIAHDILDTDLQTYHEMLDHLSVHDAEDVLPRIRVPTLIVAGDRDIITPHQAAERMAKSISGAELFILNNASHYSLLEFPQVINARLEGFLIEHKMMRKMKTTRG